MGILPRTLCRQRRLLYSKTLISMRVCYGNSSWNLVQTETFSVFENPNFPYGSYGCVDPGKIFARTRLSCCNRANFFRSPTLSDPTPCLEEVSGSVHKPLLDPTQCLEEVSGSVHLRFGKQPPTLGLVPERFGCRHSGKRRLWTYRSFTRYARAAVTNVR